MPRSPWTLVVALLLAVAVASPAAADGSPPAASPLVPLERGTVVAASIRSSCKGVSTG